MVQHSFHMEGYKTADQTHLVIVEKPFTPTSKECDELIAISKQHQRLLTVYQSEQIRHSRIELC